MHTVQSCRLDRLSVHPVAGNATLRSADVNKSTYKRICNGVIKYIPVANPKRRTPMNASIGSRALNATAKYAPTAGRFSQRHLFSCARTNRMSQPCSAQRFPARGAGQVVISGASTCGARDKSLPRRTWPPDRSLVPGNASSARVVESTIHSRTV